MRRLPLAALAIVAAALLAACGDDTVEPADAVSVSSLPDTDPPATEPPATDPPDTDPPDTDPPATDPPATDLPDTDLPDTDPPSTDPAVTDPPTSSDVGPAGYEHPAGADDVVVSYAETSGFTTREYAFQSPPTVLVTGDGHVITAGATIEIFPGPLLPALQVQTITDDGIQAVLAAADEAGLLRDVDYADDADQFVADASTAVVEIEADGESWVHSAYALGIAPPPGGEMELSPDREALLGFIESLVDLPTLVGAENLGDAEPFVPEAYEIVAVAVDEPSAFGQDDIEPTIVDWPDEVGVRLVDATECTRVAADEVGELLESANQLTLFADGDVTYQLLARQVIPGRSCDDA